MQVITAVVNLFQLATTYLNQAEEEATMSEEILRAWTGCPSVSEKGQMI